MKALLGWCKLHTEGYKDVNVTNMTTSWSDGLAFCALLHRFRPDLIDFDSLSKENVFYNNDLAFSVAERELDIAALLDAEDMANMKVPDKLSVMTYLSQYYNCFRNCNPADAPVPDVPVVNANSLRRNNGQSVKLSEKEQSEENICAICGKHVHLVQKYFEKGKLYHRTCHRNDSLEKLRSKKFFRPAGNDDEAASDDSGDVKVSRKDAKHRRLEESEMSDSKKEQHTPDLDKMRSNGHIQNMESRSEDSPKSSSAKSTLTVQVTPNAEPPVSPKPRARKISAQKQETAQPKKLPVSPTRPVATPRSRGNSSASKPSVKAEEPPPVVTYDDSLNPFGTSGSDSDTTLSSSSSSEDEPVRPARHVTAGASKEKGASPRIQTPQDDESHEQESLNPFGDVDDAEDDGQVSEVREESGRKEPSVKNDDDDIADEDPKCLNPFGDVEEEEDGVSTKLQEPSENEGNPFGECSDEDELENEGNPFGEYEEKKPPARPPPPKISIKERHNPFTGDGKVDIFPDTAAKESKKKKRPAPVPPQSASSPPLRPPSWKISPKKKHADEINKAAERKMKEINNANATDPKFGRTCSKKPAPPPPQPKSPAKMERKNVPTSLPKSATRAEGGKNNNPPTPGKRERNENKKPPPPKNIRSSRAAPGHGYPLIKRKVERKMSESSIANELEVLDVQLSDLEVKGVKLEEMLRFTMDKDMDWTKEEDELLQEWFELVSKKNMLLRRESELVFLMQQQKLEEEHADIEFQLRKLLNKPDNTKTDQDKLDEEKLLQRLLEVVESRNVIINSIEEERIKEAEEDSAYEKLKKLQDNPNKKKKKNKVKKIFSKRDKKEKHAKVKDA